MLPGKPLARKTVPAACGMAQPLPQHRAVLLESPGTGWGTGASRRWHGACCHPEQERVGSRSRARGRRRAQRGRHGDSRHGLGDGEMSSEVQAEHAGTGESDLRRERERGGGGRGEEGGVINRKLSIPQHLRDRGIAVIRPRGRKLAGLRERKPRLEEAAEESEVEGLLLHPSQRRTEGRRRRRRREGEREAHTERAEEQQGSEGRTDLRQDTALPAALRDVGSHLEQLWGVRASPWASCKPPAHLPPAGGSRGQNGGRRAAGSPPGCCAPVPRHGTL